MSHAISALFWEYLEGFYPFQMCCLELTGIPLMMGIQGYAMMRGYPVNAFIVRKERKASGRQRQLEGTLNDLPIVFLDDILNSGDSIERAIAALSSSGRRIAHVVALVDFGTSPAGDRLLRYGIHLKSLIKLEELGLTKSPQPQSNDIRRQIFHEVWKFTQGRRKSCDVVPKSTPAIDRNRIYFGSDDGYFYAVNCTTGELAWRFLAGTSKSKGIRSSPAFANDAVYFGAYDGVLYALDIDTGHLNWRFNEADWIGSSPCVAPELNILYVGLEYALPEQRGGLVALNLDTGGRIWEVPIESLVHSSPTFIKERQAVVVGSNHGAVYCVDAVSAAIRWTFNANGSVKSRASYDSNSDLIIFGSFDKSVVALSASTGALAWKFATEGVIYSEPLVLGDHVYVSSTDKSLYVLKLTDGTLINRFHCGAKLFCSPSCWNHRIYVASTSGAVYEFDPRTHALIGTHFVGDRITSAIQCDESQGRFYVLTNDCQLMAYERT